MSRLSRVQSHLFPEFRALKVTYVQNFIGQNEKVNERIKNVKKVKLFLEKSDIIIIEVQNKNRVQLVF